MDFVMLTKTDLIEAIEKFRIIRDDDTFCEYYEQMSNGNTDCFKDYIAFLNHSLYDLIVTFTGVKENETIQRLLNQITNKIWEQREWFSCCSLPGLIVSNMLADGVMYFLIRCNEWKRLDEMYQFLSMKNSNQWTRH